jgi:hypothetical protein
MSLEHIYSIHLRIKIHQDQKQSADEQQKSKTNLERHNLLFDLHLLPLVGAELRKLPLHKKTIQLMDH